MVSKVKAIRIDCIKRLISYTLILLTSVPYLFSSSNYIVFFRVFVSKA